MLLFLRQPPVLAVAAPASTPGEVTIVEFSDEGKKLRKVHLAKVIKTEEEWKQQLSPGGFEITRHADTEPAFTGQYWNQHEKSKDKEPASFDFPKHGIRHRARLWWRGKRDAHSFARDRVIQTIG